MITPPRIYKKEELIFTDVDGKVEVSTLDNSIEPISTSFQYEDLAFSRVDELVVEDFNIRFHREQYTPNIINKLTDGSTEPLIWKRDSEGKWLTRAFTTGLVGDSTFVIATPKVCTMLQLRRDFEPDTIDCYLYTHKVGKLSGSIDVYRDVSYQETIKYEKGGPESPPEFLITDKKLYWINFVLD